LNQAFPAGNGGTISFTASNTISISDLSLLDAKGGKGQVDDGGAGGTIILTSQGPPPESFQT